MGIPFQTRAFKFWQWSRKLDKPTEFSIEDLAAFRLVLPIGPFTIVEFQPQAFWQAFCATSSSVWGEWCTTHMFGQFSVFWPSASWMDSIFAIAIMLGRSKRPLTFYIHLKPGTIVLNFKHYLIFLALAGFCSSLCRTSKHFERKWTAIAHCL